MAWKATRISADAADKMQMNAGLLVKNFDITNPVKPANADIVCDTTGDFSITCTPETTDFFEDVNNAPTNMKEGKHITGWTCSLTVTSLSITAETLKVALGAADIGSDGGVNPRTDYQAADFISLYWLGDMVDEDKLMVVVMDNTVSTGGISFTSTNKGKGGLSLELSPHASAEDQTKVPMAFYVLEKVGDESTGLATITVASAAGTASGDTKLTISNFTPASGAHYVYKTASGTAPTIGYHAVPDYTWTAWNGSSDITATNGHKITVVSVNSNNQAVASGNATVVART